jgi:serine protease AprX
VLAAGGGILAPVRSFATFVLSTTLALVVLFAAASGEAQSGGPAIDPRLERILAVGGEDTQIRAILTYDRRPTATQVETAQRTGVDVHRFDVLPMLGVRGTKEQIEELFSLRGLVSVYADRKLEYLLHESVKTIRAHRVTSELGYTGRGIGVAVIDSGVDGTNRDVRYPGRLVQNAKIVGDNIFTGATVVLEDQPITDTTSGHGTHVTGIVGGSGANSDGYYTGVAPKSDLVGIGTGDTLFVLYALEGFDYALENQDEYDIRVISNSWGTNGKFRKKDPVNRASKVAHDRGITVVFAAGNEGPKRDTLNPYSVAPWVIGVAAGKKNGKTLADFSSRGVPGSDLYHPTITAPGVNIVSARASTGATINALDAADDATYISPQYQPYYTTASGTSMAAPHVSGTVAMMEQANGALGPDGIKRIITGTADSMPDYREFQVGAGYLDAYAAVKEARAAD